MPTFNCTAGVRGMPLGTGRRSAHARSVALLLTVTLMAGLLGACDDGGGLTNQPGPCAGSAESVCATVAVADGSALRSVAYARGGGVAPAATPVLVLGGGPGLGAVRRADELADRLEPVLGSGADLLVMDPYGTGASDVLACPVATAAWEAATLAASAPDALVAAARAFAPACIAEAGIDPAAGVFAHDRAAEDVEAVRSALGIERLVIYAESYGARIARAYAARHPERAERLVLDAPVEPHPMLETWRPRVAELGHSVRELLAWCASDAACVTSFAAEPADVYAILRSRARSGTLAPGTGLAAFDRLVALLVGDPEGRLELLRLLAEARRGNPAPLAEHLDVLRDGVAAPEAFSDAAYHAAQCADWQWEVADPEARAAALVGLIDPADALTPAYVLARDLPCAFWSSAGVPAEPPAGPLPPTLVVAADPDWAAPAALTGSIADELGGPRIVVEQGPHIAVGRSGDCVDDAVRAFLAAGSPPPAGLACSLAPVAGP